MLGAIIGDIVGSRFEWNNIKSKEFELFTDRCFPTDDSIMTVAVAQALLDCAGDYTHLGEKAVYWMREIGRRYPGCGYGGRFIEWLFSDDPHPYRSYGNGAAMRVSACGFIAGSLEQAKALSRAVTEVTHDHPEGLKGAEATAAAIWLARHGKSIMGIRAYIQNNYYPLDFTLDEIRPAYTFDVTCQGSVPQAIEAFLESAGFEDAIRGAVSIGGDSDTIAAITGGIAQAYYGIPKELADQALGFLDPDLRGIVDRFRAFFDRC